MASGHQLRVRDNRPSVYEGFLCRSAARTTGGAWLSARIQAAHLVDDRACNGLSGACKTYRYNLRTRSFRVLILENTALLVEPVTGAWKLHWVGSVFSLQFLPFWKFSHVR